MARYNNLSVGNLTVDNVISGDIGTITGGTKFYLDTVNGSDGNDGKAPNHAFKTLATAYAALTANKNDILYMLPGASAATITTAIDWNKSYTHFIGLAAATQVGPRCRVNTTTAMTPMITWSANGCQVRGIQFSNNHSHATAGAVCFKLTGARNNFEFCHFQGLGALGVVDNSHRAIVIESSDAENRFDKCTFGATTVDGVTATNFVMEFTGAVNTARNQFVECLFLGNGSANSSFIKADGAGCLSTFQLFKECLFYNNIDGDFDAMTQGFVLTNTPGGYFIFMDCLVFGAATLETTNSGLIFVRNAPAAATGDIAIAATF